MRKAAAVLCFNTCLAAALAGGNAFAQVQTDDIPADEAPSTHPLPKPAAPAPAESYAPRSLVATHPMKVIVVTATSFRDVESGQAFRLYGIDACDAAQTAAVGKQVWPCGTSAIAWLVSATLNKWVVCTPIRQDGEVMVARCATGETSDLAAEMLKTGYAVCQPDPDDRRIATYPKLEADARKGFRGLWGSSFQMPWVFRQQARAPSQNP